MRLGITRIADQLKEVSRLASSRGIEVIPLPVIEIDAIDFDWPCTIAMQDIDWLVFSSSNSVHLFFSKVRAENIELSSDISIACVGGRTADTVRKYGYDIAFIPSGNYGELLFIELMDHIHPRTATIVHPRCEEVQFEPGPFLHERGFTYRPIIAYRTIPAKIDESVARSLKSDDYILYTAPSTVRSWNKQFGKPIARPIAIGRSTANAMNKIGWAGFATMSQAKVEEVLEYIQ